MDANTIPGTFAKRRKTIERAPKIVGRAPAREAVAEIEDPSKLGLRAGDWIEIRSKDEILATLDKGGRLDQMPFMPQMFQYCGQRFQVFKRAHKTCDPIYTMASRRLNDAVHLELRCDGKAHGGCQVGCLLFWKEAWLKPLKADGTPLPTKPAAIAKRPLKERCSEKDVLKATTVGPKSKSGKDTQYVCQTTELPKFSTHLPWWNFNQYVEDYKSGNTTIDKMVFGTFYSIFVRYPTRLALPRYIYNGFQALIGGDRSPVDWGYVPVGQPLPIVDHKLKSGDLVRVKPHKEILTTLDRRNKNRGLYFDVEMVPFCGSVYRVRNHVGRFIDEKTGKMTSLKTPAVILEGVYCRSHFSKRRMYCPRGLHSWWREAWLERVTENALGDADLMPCQTIKKQAERLETARTTKRANGRQKA